MSKSSKKTAKKKVKSPRCHQCGQAIRVPKGWNPGSAVRRHYWAKHRETMLKPYTQS